MLFSSRVKLPTTDAEYESLLTRLMEKYSLKDRLHADGIVSMTIRHLPRDQATATLDYFGACIIKNMAHQLAEHRAKTIQHGMQVKHLEDLLKTEPNNQQAMDELEKAAREGSQAAKDALERLLPKPEQNVVAITNG